MTWPVLTRAGEALGDAETTALLRDRLGDGVVGEVSDFGEHTVELVPAAWHAAVAACRDEPLLSFDLFDCLFGVDAGDDGLAVVAVLYSTSKGRRIMLRTICDGGRDNPVLDTVTDVYGGANWMERETFDMFGIEFVGHPGLLPRLLCVENFEGWPLRKDFALATRVAKPWPGVKEPAELDEDGNVIERQPMIGDAPGPSSLDAVIAKQAREANPRLSESAEPEDSPDSETADAPKREEVGIDQETFDRLLAEGKSERIARSKAKAAFVKKQRAQAAAEPDAAEPAETEPAETEPAETEPAGTEPAGTEPAGTEPAEADADAEPEPAEPAEPGETARGKADAARRGQARAREARAQAEPSAVDSGDDVTAIPEGVQPPPEPDTPAEGELRPTDVEAGDLAADAAKQRGDTAGEVDGDDATGERRRD